MVKFDWKNAKEVKSTAGRKSPTFSITKSAYARLNKRFRDKYELQDIKSVKMKYEEKENKVIVGFRFFDSKEDGDFSINEDSRTESLWFSVRSLFNNLNIDRKKFTPQKFTPEVINSDDERIFVIEINLKKIK